MKASEIRELTEPELKQRLLEAEQELFNLRVRQSAGQLEKPSRIRDLRRDVARIHTVIQQRKATARTA